MAGIDSMNDVSFGQRTVAWVGVGVAISDAKMVIYRALFERVKRRCDQAAAHQLSNRRVIPRTSSIPTDNQTNIPARR
jgi:hypothetical protein